jgi:hypothetical protein
MLPKTESGQVLGTSEDANTRDIVTPKVLWGYRSRLWVTFAVDFIFDGDD